MAGTTNASPGTPEPAVAMSSKLPISVLLSGPPGLGKENAPVAPARPKTLHESVLAIEAHLEAQKKADKEKAASKKREAPGPPVDEASVDLDDFDVEEVPMTENCDQVRRKINRMLDAGGMTKTAFAAAIGVSMKSLANFLAMHGAFKDANSASYDNAWAYFKKREMAGLKLPVKKAAKMAKTDDAAATTSDATPTSISTTSTTATAKAPAGTKKAQTSSAGVDISAIHPDGEEDDRVPIFNSCDEVRRKINAHLKKPGVTQAQFCRDILARMPPPPLRNPFPSTLLTSLTLSPEHKSASRPANIQSVQLARFRGMKDAVTGGSSSVFYGAYVFFEKIRVAEGKPKTQHRLDMEAFWGSQGGVSRESERGGL